MKRSHWVKWHDAYDDPDSPLSARLAEVQRQLRVALDESPSGELRLIALCAGQGRDVLEVLHEHPRAEDVSARLVELDTQLAADASARAHGRGLSRVEVVCADASLTDTYAGAVPANIVMVCGVFGNISLSDIDLTIATLPTLSAPHAQVIWTRHRRPPDRTPEIRRMFSEHGYHELEFVAPSKFVFGVGTQRLERAPRPFVSGLSMFTFTGDGTGAA